MLFRLWFSRLRRDCQIVITVAVCYCWLMPCLVWEGTFHFTISPMVTGKWWSVLHWEGSILLVSCYVQLVIISLDNIVSVLLAWQFTFQNTWPGRAVLWVSPWICISIFISDLMSRINSNWFLYMIYMFLCTGNISYISGRKSNQSLLIPFINFLMNNRKRNKLCHNSPLDELLENVLHTQGALKKVDL